MAVHSDTWLLAVAFYNGARLNREGRERLFELINEQPTCYEIVSGKASRDAAKPKKRGAPGQPSRPPSMAPPAKIPRMVRLAAHITHHRVPNSAPPGQAAYFLKWIGCWVFVIMLRLAVGGLAACRRPIFPAELWTAL